MKNRLSRGLRNLNPGNIRVSKTRYKGERSPSADKAFKQFESIEYGYRAMFVLLHTYKVRGYCTTIEDIINRYAPPFENNTSGYISKVCLGTGFDKDFAPDTLSKEQMIPIVCTMSEVENGVPADYKDVEAGWLLFIADFS